MTRRQSDLQRRERDLEFLMDQYDSLIENGWPEVLDRRSILEQYCETIDHRRELDNECQRSHCSI